jgi:hypothetical protein
MTADLQEHLTPTKPRAFRRAEAAILAAVIGIAALLVATTFIPCRHNVWIDPVTGSIKRETQWFGQTTHTVIEPSAIERWISEHNDPHSNHWKFLHATYSSMWGNPVGCGCGIAPAIYSLSNSNLCDEFVHNSTDQEINNFVRVMQAGTEDEKQKAVDAAIQRAIPQPANQRRRFRVRDVAPACLVTDAPIAGENTEPSRATLHS